MTILSLTAEGTAFLRQTGYRFQYHNLKRFEGDAGRPFLIPQPGGKEENGKTV
jgi:hypothetical protein